MTTKMTVKEKKKILQKLIVDKTKVKVTWVINHSEEKLEEFLLCNIPLLGNVTDVNSNTSILVAQVNNKEFELAVKNLVAEYENERLRIYEGIIEISTVTGDYLIVSNGDYKTLNLKKIKTIEIL